MSKGFYGAFSEQMDRLQSSVDSIQEPLEIDEDGGIATSLPIDALAPGSNQPRRNFQDAELEELAESIRQQGLIQPVVVRSRNDGNYEILAGERRWRACKLVGAEVVLTGIQPQMAHTLIGLGVDLGDIVTRSTLQAGIAYALQVEDAVAGPR